MTRQNQIRLRPDGSIDTAHYMEIGRQMRSEQAHRLARQLKPARKPPQPSWIGRLFAGAKHQGA
jgi:hypothetical protein